MNKSKPHKDIDTKKAEKIAVWAKMMKKSQKEDKDKTATQTLNDRKVIAWRLRSKGWTQNQVAQGLMVSVATVVRWDKQVKDNFAEQPSIQLAIDIMQSLVPKAIGVYDSCLESLDEKVALAAAKDVLLNFSVMTDRKEVIIKSDGPRDNAELIAEAQGLIAGAAEPITPANA